MISIFKINIFTYLFILLYILSGYYKDIIIIYSILIIHEFGHYYIMKFYNINIYKIELYPYGGMISSNMLINNNSISSIFISIGGIFFQIILFFIFYMLFKYNFIGINIYNLFNKYNSSIILFNLIPIYPLDGYKLLNSILELLFNFRYSLFISFIISIILFIIFIIYMFYYKINNYIIILFLLCNIIKFIKEYKYIINKFYIERKIYDIKYMGLISVKERKYMYKNKYNYINGVGEKIL